MSIYNEYFTLDTTWKEKYGEKTVVLFQVGAFFEVYGIKDLKQNTQTNTIEIFSQMSNLRIAAKSKTFYGDNSNMQIVMAGFRDYQLEYYLEKITENGFTAVVFVQEDKAVGEKGKNRIFSGVYSPGTYLSYNDNVSKVSNYLMCIWILQRKHINICGIVVIDIITGKSFIFEYEADNNDQLERYISVYNPNEVLFISQNNSGLSNSGLSTFDTIEHLFQSSVSFHVIDMSSNKIKNVLKQTYIEEILNKQFGTDTFQNCFEFNQYPVATMAFCYLLDFIYEHNSNLVKNIQIPLFNNSHERVVLANHTLKQLNILDDGNGQGHLSSVLSFLNKCSCAIGKRRFRQQLLNPVYDEVWLQSEYTVVNEILKSENRVLIAPFRKMMIGICDIEKISRQLAIKKIFHSSISQLFRSLETIEQIHVCLAETLLIQNYLTTKDENSFHNHLKEMMDFIKSQIIVERGSQTFPKGFGDDEDEDSMVEDENNNIMCIGVSSELDSLMQEYEDNKMMLEKWRETLNQLVSAMDSSKKRNVGEKDSQYIKIHKTEKSGVSLQITKTRSKLLKDAFKNNKTLTIMGITIETKDIELSSASTSTNEIDCPHLTKIVKRLFSLKDQIGKVMDREYNLFLVKLETSWFSFLNVLVEYVGKLDVLICRAHNAIEYNYCCPSIVSESERGKVSAKNLRHVLIEHLITNETYTANDVELSEEPQGILLFGINSSGKTSLLRSLGISLILAQSGNFVPASKFEYKPYRSIYSRIIGNDNLFKGHSSFAVEMTELRMILKMADPYSMVLADEISKGSEMDSAMSITTASIMNFVKLGCSFMITSHLHEIVGFDEIRELSRQVHLKHLLVTFDYEQDLLVYDRHLRDGSGESFYGLLVCKSLHMPQDFIDTAYNIRNKYLTVGKSILSQKTSVYNGKKIRGLCEMCGEEMAEEVHHLTPQKDANAEGFFENGMHKNHVGNLSALCSKCHDVVHHSSPVKKVVKVVKKKVIKNSSL
jgi:DNA mismatch repair protein MutS